MGGKHYTIKTKSGICKKIISKLIFCIFIFLMIFSSMKIFNWMKENKESKDIIEEIQTAIYIDEKKDNIDKYNINFEILKQKNSDTIAWFKVNGTNIKYPIVKADDNEYYMDHSYDKSYNSVGWVFMDYRDRFDGNDKNMVIYAHNRKDGSMFGTLKNILTEEWQSNEENYIIPFITENEKTEYQVFSVYQIEKEDYYITTNFENDDEFQKFINTIKSRSIKDFGVDVANTDNILTLSTCASDNRYRVVLHAKKIIN